MKKKPVKSPIQVAPKVSREHKREKWKQAVNVLNDIVRFKLAPSDIHGVGVFAIYDIPKGTTLDLDAIPHAFDLPYSQFKKLKPEIREIVLNAFPTVVDGSHFIYPVVRYPAYLNHSNEPNYCSKTDKTLRKIKAGEEITEDYRQIKNYNKIYKWLK